MNYTIDLSIYDINLVNQAIEDFQDLAHIAIKNNILNIQIENIDESDEVFNELMNYTLSILN